MAIVLGITNTQDSGACLLKNGKIIAAINEERFNRDKLTQKFPINSIKWILKECNLKKNEIDAIGMGIWKGISKEFFPEYVNEIISRSEKDRTGNILQDRFESSVKSDQVKKQEFFDGLKRLGLEKIPIFWCDHHLAHAYSAFMFSPFNNALTITSDARGDFLSSSVTIWKRGRKPKIIHQDSEFNSLGVFYGWITNYLGFTPYRHEGKITGLAALGDPKKCLHIMKKMIGFRKGKIISNIGEYYAPYVKAKLPKLRKELSKYTREEIAAAAQFWLERLMVDVTKFYLNKTKETNLCVAGGIFANVLVNMKLREIDKVKGFFVFPHMGDGGIAAGGGAYASTKLDDRVKSIKDVYLGIEFSEKQIFKSIKAKNVTVRKPKKIFQDTAKLLEKGAVVGFFSGKTEYGPRALCNRSVLVRTTDKKINIDLNKRLHRTEFMPFAPVTMEKFAKKCYKNWSKNDITSYFMTCCFKCTELLKKQSPAIVHIDGTARPQILNKNINKQAYEILNEYYKITGIPSLINTSFNAHEEPIVNNPKDALKLLKQNGIDILCIPPYIVYKNKKWEKLLK
jgi:carbamoyltransferase|tara:strand:+ start:4944 stop:6647 length:1704 start_codon:yes stop_codon:yes gene_type:complete